MNSATRLLMMAGVTTLSLVASRIPAAAQAMNDHRAQGQSTNLTVDNTRDVPVMVYLDRGQFETRIGTVQPNRQSTLEIPDWIVRRETTAQFILTPRGQAKLASSFLDLGRGSHFFIEVPVFGR